MTKEQEITKLINDLVDQAFDSGYYQATMEKNGDVLSDQELKKYAAMNNTAIQEREFIRNRLFRYIFPEVYQEHEKQIGR